MSGNGPCVGGLAGDGTGVGARAGGGDRSGVEGIAETGTRRVVVLQLLEEDEDVPLSEVVLMLVETKTAPKSSAPGTRLRLAYEMGEICVDC